MPGVNARRYPVPVKVPARLIVPGLADVWGGTPQQNAAAMIGQAAAEQATGATTDVQSPAWWDVVGQFNAAYSDFGNWLAQLQARADEAAAAGMGDEYSALVARAQTLQGTIQSTLDGINGSIGWVKQQAASAASWAQSMLHYAGLAGYGRGGGLGFVQIIAAAAIAAALALMVKWIADAKDFSNRLDAAGQVQAQIQTGTAAYVSQGLDPTSAHAQAVADAQAAAAAVGTSGAPTFGGNLGKYLGIGLVVVAVGAGLYFYTQRGGRKWLAA